MDTTQTIPPSEPSRVDVAIAESRKIRSGIAAECDRIEQLLTGFREGKSLKPRAAAA